MKNKIRKLFRHGFTFFVMGLLTTSCDRDNFIEEDVIQIDAHKPALIIEGYSKDNISENTRLVQKLKELDDNLIKNKSAKATGKDIYNKEYDFTIFTDSATYIQNGDYLSYTFPIVQGPDEKITNVIFEVNDQNEYDAYLVKYDYTSNELKYQDFNSLSMKTIMKPIDFDINSLFAKTKSAYVCIYSYEEKCTEGHVSGSPGYGGGNLGGTGTRCSWVLTAGHCETVYSYDEDYRAYHQGNTATVTIGGKTYGGTGGSRTSPMPSPFSSEELLKINVVKDKLNLRNNYDGWINSHGKTVTKIYDYLVKNLFSQEAIGFGKSGFVELYNGGEVDFNNEIIKHKSFVGTKADCVLKALLQQTGFYKEVMNAFTNNNSNNKIKFTVGNLTKENVGGEGQTAAPDSNGVVTTTITPAASQGNPLAIAGLLLHEGVHAQLHRIIATGNKTQYNLSSAEFKWLKDLNEWWKDYSNQPFTAAQHDFMAVKYVTPIANAVRKYDSYAQPLKNYMYFGWEGLYDEAGNRGLIDMKEFNAYTTLAQLPLTKDNHRTSCD